MFTPATALRKETGIAAVRKLHITKNNEPLSPALAARCKNVKDNPRARRFFRLYCAGMSQREAAQQVGVHPKTASWWRQHPDGKQLMREIYEQMDHIMMLDTAAMHMANVESTLAKRRRR